MMEVDVCPDSNFYDDYAEDIPFYCEYYPDETLNTAVLDPGESTYYLMEFDWGEKSTSQEEMSMTFKFKLNFEQVAAN